MASLFLRGNIYWVLYYESGKKIQHSLKTRDRKVAQFRTNEIENRLAQGESPLLDASITSQECFDEYKQSREGVIAKQTSAVDHPRIQKVIDDGKIVLIKNFTESTLKAYLDNRLRVQEIGRVTANHIIRASKTFLAFCVRRHYAAENSLRFMRRYPVDKIEPRFLSSEEVKALLAEAESNEIYPLILAAVYTGMRLEELERLLWEDVDFAQNTITVTKSKSGSFRKIPIHKELKSELLKNRKKTGPCLTDKRRSFIYRRFADILEGLKDTQRFTLHDLRHTFASMMIKSGVDIYTLSKLLGHSSVQTTEIYAHLYDDHQQEAMAKLKI